MAPPCMEQELQLQLEHLTILGPMLLVTFSMVAPGISFQADFAGKLKMIAKTLPTGMHLPSFHLKDALTTTREKVCMEVGSCLSLRSDKQTVLKGQTQAMVSPDDPISRIMNSCILTNLETYLASGHQKPFLIVPVGLGPVQNALEEVAIEFVCLFNYNKMVFSSYYDALLSKILIGS